MWTFISVVFAVLTGLVGTMPALAQSASGIRDLDAAQRRSGVHRTAQSVSGGVSLGNGIKQASAGHGVEGGETGMRGTVPPLFAQEVRYATGAAPRSVAIGDLNGDGIVDLAVANDLSDNVSILPGIGDGTFAAGSSIAVDDGPSGIAISDFNGDGLPDLVTANRSDASVSILIGNGDGTFLSAVHYSAGNGALSVAVGDFDADGDQDFVIGNISSSAVSVFLGNGDGTFQAQQVYSAGHLQRSVAVGDLNGDGHLDIAAATDRDGQDDVSILFGVGDGTFSAHVTLAAGDRSESVVIADLNGDGANDLVVANKVSHDISVLYGNGNGSFQPQQFYPTGIQSFAVATGDINLDGEPDIVGTNLGTDEASLLLSNGDGTFQHFQDIGVGFTPRSLAICDLDMNGTVDIVFANYGGNDVSVTLNQSIAYWTGSTVLFGAPQNWSGGVAPSLSGPTLAVFDSTVEPFGPLSFALLQNDVSFAEWRQANERIELLMNGNTLTLSAPANGLSLGAAQVGGPDPFPLVPPELLLNNTNGKSPSVLATASATVGADGPATLELIADSGTVSLDVSGDFVVGAGGAGTVRIIDDAADASIVYGGPGEESVVIGGGADGTVELLRGCLTSAQGVRSLMLGRDAGATGTVRIVGSSSVSPCNGVWSHTGESFTVGREGSGVIELLAGARLELDVISTITLAELEGSSSLILVSGEGSEWDTGFSLVETGLGESTITVEDSGTISGLGLINTSGSTIQGNGVISVPIIGVTNFGTIAPSSNGSVRGNEPGTLTIDGDYDQFDNPLDPEISGRLAIDLFSAGGVLDSDVLLVTGDANLAGGLLVTASASVESASLDSVTVLQAGDLSGRFDVAFLPGVTPDAMGAGRFLRVDYPVLGAESGSSVSVNLVVDTLTGQIDTEGAEHFDVNGQPSAAAVGDLNNDQLLDLAVAIPDPNAPTSAPGSVVVLFNAGSTSGVWNGFSGSIQLTVGVDPSGVAIGEADLDGGLDIGVTNRMDDTAMIITNDGLAMPSSLNISQTIPVGDAPASIVFGDLDEDKWDDVAIANFGSDNVTILQNQQGIGGGWNGMGGAQTFPAGDGPVDIVFGDLDEDKWDDVIVLNANDGTVTYLDNSFPPGTFGPPMVLGADAGPSEFGVADLDGDGANDIFTANAGADSVSVILGNGDSTFEPVVNLPLAGSPRSVAAVDLDDDLDLDLAIVADDAMGVSTIRVLRNDLTDGQLIFAPDADIDAGGEPLFVLSGDVDDDGQGDLVTVNSTSGARSAESGAPAMPIGVVRQSAPPCPGDCDGNGVVEFNDLVTMLFEFGNETAPLACDADGSGVVEFNDLVAALFLFGPCP